MGTAERPRHKRHVPRRRSWRNIRLAQLAER